MKNALWVVSAAVVGVGAYLFLGADDAPAPRVEMPEAVVETPAPVVVQEEVETTVETQSSQLEDVIKQAEPDQEKIDEVVSTLVAIAKQKADEASEGASTMTEQAQELVTDGVQAARDGAMKIPEYLTFEGFDAEKVKEFINTSDLSGTQKIFLNSAVDKAQESPELLKAALEQLQTALGLES